MTTARDVTEARKTCPVCEARLMSVDDVIGTLVARYECGRKTTKRMYGDWRIYTGCPNAEDVILELRAQLKRADDLIACMPSSAALSAARAEGEQAQLERDCKAVCIYCLETGKPKTIEGRWRHNESWGMPECLASFIRQAGGE